MAKLAAKNANFTLNSVAIEDEITSITRNINQEVIDVEGLSATGPEKVIGNYQWDIALQGNADFAASQGDATIYALIGGANSGVTSGFDPTGNTAAANDPNYDGNVVLASYSITAAVGAAITYSASLTGAGASSRAVA